MRRVIGIFAASTILFGWGTARGLAQGASGGTGASSSAGATTQRGTTTAPQPAMTVPNRGVAPQTNSPPGSVTLGQQGSTAIGQQGSIAIGQQGSTAIGQQGSTAIGQQGSVAIGQQGSTAIGRQGTIIGVGLGATDSRGLAMGTNAGRPAMGTNAGRLAMGTNRFRRFATNRNGLVYYTNGAGRMVLRGTNTAVGGASGRQGAIIGTGAGSGTNRP